MTKYQRCDVGSDSIKCESMSNWADTMQFQTGSKQVKILFPGRTDPQNVSLLGRVLTLPRQLTWRAQSGPHHSWCLFSFYYFFCQDGNDQDKMAAKCRTLGKLSITQKGRRTLGHLYTSVIHQAKYKSFVLHQCINTPPNHCSHNTRTKSRSKEKKFAINRKITTGVCLIFLYITRSTISVILVQNESWNYTHTKFSSHFMILFTKVEQIYRAAACTFHEALQYCLCCTTGAAGTVHYSF